MARLRGWTDCNVRGEMTSLAPYMHDDFVHVSVFGRRHDKAAYLELASSLVGGA